MNEENKTPPTRSMMGAISVGGPLLAQSLSRLIVATESGLTLGNTEEFLRAIVDCFGRGTSNVA
jgi:hypothetical protein